MLSDATMVDAAKSSKSRAKPSLLSNTGMVMFIWLIRWSSPV